MRSDKEKPNGSKRIQCLYTAIVRDKLLRCPMLVVCSRNQDATTNAQIGLAQKYNRIVTTLDGLKKAVSEGDDLVS